MAQSSLALTLGNISVRQLDGLYSLNDLHVASGSEAKHQPALFARRKATRELVAAIGASTDSQTPLRTINDGENNGTYACRELVIAYAAWISAAFHLKVIRVFLAVTQPVQPAAQAQVPALPAFLPAANVLSILGLASAMGTLVQQTVFKSVLAEGDDWKNGRWVMEFIKDSECAAPPIIRCLKDDERITTGVDIARALLDGEFSRPDLLAIANAAAQRLYVQSCTDGAQGIGAQVSKLINRDLSQTDLREIVTSACLELWMRAIPEKSA